MIDRKESWHIVLTYVHTRIDICRSANDCVPSCRFETEFWHLHTYSIRRAQFESLVGEHYVNHAITRGAGSGRRKLSGPGRSCSLAEICIFYIFSGMDQPP
ncbi:hypothetical protein KCU89_g12, partial [Aureobasidium melanogenum]